MELGTIISFLVGALCGAAGILFYKKQIRGGKIGIVEVDKTKIAIEQNVEWPLKDSFKLFYMEMQGLLKLSNNDAISIERAERIFNSISESIELNENISQIKWWNDFTNDRLNWSRTLYIEKAGELLQHLKNAGVEHGKEKEVIWNQRTKHLYSSFDNVEENQKCRVILPYWLHNGSLFVQGIVEIIK